MYGRGASALMTGGVATGSGAVILPHTSGNVMGMTLAYVAIAIGIAVIASQITVRVLRKKYQK